MVIGAVVALAIVVAAPYLAPGLLAALGTTTATALALSVTTALIGGALALGATLAMKALGFNASPSNKAPTQPIIVRQTLTDSYIIYGRRRVIYLKWVFFHGKKVGSKHFRYFAFAVAGHRCAGNPSWMLNDEAVTVDGSGVVTSGKYAGKIQLWFQRGLDTETANPTFVAECGGKWTSNHRGDGVAMIYMKAEMTDAVVEAGFCTPSPVIDGKDDIYDYRDDTTGFTRNATLVSYDWMRLPRHDGGFGISDNEVPNADWLSAQANVCDEDVDGEPRYALDGVIVTGAEPAGVRDTLVINQAGSYTFSEGKHFIRPGYWVPPSEVLEERDLAGAIQFQPFLPEDAAANEVQGSFVDPAANYQPMPFPMQTTDPAPTNIRQMDLDLAWITSPQRAARVGRVMLRRAQCEKQGSWPMNIMGLRVKALDTVQCNTARYGLSNYAFAVSSWQFSPDFGAVLSLREENEEIYADPTPVTPEAIPTIEQGEVVITEANLVTLISTSFTTDADPPDGLLQSTTDGEITVEGHTRTYDDIDAPVAVDGDTLTGLTPGTYYHVHYDDPDREGGAVTYVATEIPEDAATTPTNPGRHYVGSIIATAGESAGGAAPPGWTGGSWNNTGPEYIYDGQVPL